MEHQPRTQHRNADGLSQRTNDYRWREQQLEKLPPEAERWYFLSQDEYECLPTAPWFDVQERIIPNNPELPSHLKKIQPTRRNLVQRVIRRTQRIQRQEKQKEALQAPLPLPPPPILLTHQDFYPDYPEDWIDVTEEASHNYLVPTRVTNVASRTTQALAKASRAVLQNAAKNIRQTVFAVRTLSTELHEHAELVHGIKDLLLAQK